MPKNSNTKKKACAQEVKAIIEDDRKIFNLSSDKQYSLASDLVDFDNGVQYEVSVHREEINIFLNQMVYITVYGNAEGRPSVQGTVTQIEDTHQSSFVILAKAIVGGQAFDRYRLELSEIQKIKGENPKSMLSFNTMANSFPSPPTSSGLTSDSSRYGKNSRPGSRGSQLPSATQYFPERKRSLSRGSSKRVRLEAEKDCQACSTYSQVVTRQSPTPAQGPPFRDSSFPPLESRSSCPTTTAKRPKTPI
jgi:hypothetical protein